MRINHSYFPRKMAPSKSTSYYRRGKVPTSAPDLTNDDDYNPQGEEGATSEEDIQVRPRKAQKPPRHSAAADSQGVMSLEINTNSVDTNNSVASGSEAAPVPVRSTGKYQPRRETPKGVAKPVGKPKRAASQPAQTRREQDRQIIHTSGMYKIKDIIDEDEQGGQVMYLMDWQPTWVRYHPYTSCFIAVSQF